MKKVFLGLLTALFVFTACDFSKPTETEGTKLVVPEWVDNVYSVALESKNGQGAVAVHKADSCMAHEYFSGQVTLRIDYNDLSDAEKETYLGYGVLDGAANPFKVFVNGREVENESKKASVPHGDNVAEEDILYLNAYVDCFEYTFSITEDVKTVTITFENAPELIPCDKLRLEEERFYAYVDVSELEECYDEVGVWNADGTSFNRIPKGFYLFDKYIKWDHHNNYNFDYHFFVTFKTKNGTFSETNSFSVENANVTVHKTFDNSYTQCNLFIELNSTPNGGSILKLTELPPQ